MKFALFCAAFGSLALGQEPTVLFDGKSTAGWTMVGPGRFVLENGLLKTEGGMGLLYYEGHRVGDQVVRVVFKTEDAKDNAGVFIRLPEKPADPWYGVHNGYEVQIDGGGDDWHCTGAIYSLSKVEKRTQKPAGEWNTMDIQLEGDTTRIFLNGEKVNEFRGNQSVPDRKQWYEPIRGPRPSLGYIGLQNHDANSAVFFKEVSLMPLPGATILKQGDRDLLLSYLHSSRKLVVDAVAGLTDEQLNYKTAPERWSIAQVLEHIYISEQNLFNTMSAVLNKPKGEASKAGKKVTDQEIMTMMKDRSQKAEAPPAFRPGGQPAGDQVLMGFLERRDRNLAWARDTSTDLRAYQMPFFGGITIDMVQGMLLIPSHTERHVAQINEVKAAAGFPKAAATPAGGM